MQPVVDSPHTHTPIPIFPPPQRDLFLTAGFDGSVHLYHSLKQQHLLEVVPSEGPLHAVQWSPFRPLVFAAAAGESESRTEGVVFSDTVGDCPTVYGCIAGPDSPRCFLQGPADGL